MQIKIKGIQLTVEIPQLDELMERINEIALDAKSILKKEKQIMADLAELKAKVESAIMKIDALNTGLDGYRALVAQIKAELELLKSGAVLAPKVQASVDELSTLLDTEGQKIDDTIAENLANAEPPPDEV